MSKQPPPAPTARAVGSCPTLIQISRTPRHWKFTQDHRTTRPPLFQRKGCLYFACNDRNAFFTSDAVKNYNLWSCQKVCEALTFLLENIYIRFGSKLYRQIVGIPMGTNCAPFVADLFLFCYESAFMLPLSEDNQFDVIEASILLLGIWMTY